MYAAKAGFNLRPFWLIPVSVGMYHHTYLASFLWDRPDCTLGLFDGWFLFCCSFNLVKIALSFQNKQKILVSHSSYLLSYIYMRNFLCYLKIMIFGPERIEFQICLLR